jgi:biopolymer transport protein TolQ
LIAALLLQLPSDGIASQGAQPAAQNSSALVEMIQNSGPVAMAVLVLLLIASLYSWSVILNKMSSFRKATRESQRFLRAFRKATRLQEMATVAEECKASPLAQVFEEVYETYKRQTGGSGPPRNLAPLERSAQTAASEAVTTLERRLTWLATIASASPFVGLFGTVIGIVDAFHGLGAAGSATLRAVAPGISEALITTAAGLFVAIPAVIAYNQFSARIRVFAAAIDDFCRELLNSLEEIPVRVPKAARPGTPASSETGGEAVREVDSGLYK